MTGKSSVFLITSGIVCAKTVPSLMPQHPAVPPASAEAPAHETRCEHLTRPKSASDVTQAVPLWAQQKNQKSINKSISSWPTTAAQVYPSRVVMGHK